MTVSARRCPHCGAPSRRVESNWRTALILGVFLVALALFLLFLLLGGFDEASQHVRP